MALLAVPVAAAAPVTQQRVVLVKKRFTLMWPWTWWRRRRRLKRQIELQLEKRMDVLRDQMQDAMRDHGIV